MNNTGHILDLELDKYIAAPDTPPPAMMPPAQVNQEDATMMAGVGVDTAETARSGTYIQRDFYPLCLVAWSDDLELLPIGAALKRYDWLRERYAWQAVPADLNKYTAQCAAMPEPQGFLSTLRKGQRFPSPFRPVCI